MFQTLQQMQHNGSKISSKTELSAELKKIVSDKGFVISDNQGSGNCMFHALSEQLDLVKEITISHKELRREITQYLWKNPQRSDGTNLFNFVDGYQSWADYLTNMERDGTWGDHVILYAAANCYQTCIHVISSLPHHNDLTISPERPIDSANPLVLGHVHELHYVSLQPIQAMVTESSKEYGTQECSDNPPRLNFQVPKLSELPNAPSRSLNDVELPVDFLLLTVEDCEFLGFFPYLEERFKCYRKDIGYMWLGSVGSTNGSTKKLKIALMKCSKGSAVPGGSLTVVKNAVRVLRPKSVFSVGACSGLNRGKVKLGDVVVSSKLITPIHKTPASRDMGTLIRHAADCWNAPLANPDALEVRVHCDGEVLSSPEVISEDMIQQYPEAIAVELEGEGVFAAAHDLKTEWVLIKGIKDYAYDNQPSSYEWGRFASVMAASVVANILSDPVIFEEWSNYNQEAFPVDTFNVKTCQRKLAEHYQRTAKVPTTVWSSVFQVDLEQIYTRLSWVKEEQTPAGSSQSELGHYTELFTEKTKNRAVPKRILVQGETGIGKTTFVKKLLVDWSNLDDAKIEEASEREGAQKKFSDGKCKDDEDVIEDIEEASTDNKDMDKDSAKMEEERKDVLRKFELVLSINLKDISKCQTLREVISHSRLFPEDKEKSVDDFLSYLRSNQEKVLVVFDGYDEYRTSSEAEEKYGSRNNSPIYQIFSGNILRDCTVMVTTRSSRADEIRGPADIQAEITGFNTTDREEFMGKLLESQTQVNDLLRFLWKSKILDLARIPLLSLFFCLLWKEEKESLLELTESKTKLFRAIMKHILQHSHRKHYPFKTSKLTEADYEEILVEIGKVALAGLLKGDLVFKYGQLPEKVRGEESVVVGLLQLSEYGPSLEPKEMVSFIHKSIQEYLAAWYITYRCVPEGSLGGIEQHARTFEDCQALENVFQFICGLSDDGAVKVFQHLTSVRISDPTLDLSKTIPDVENETGVPLCNVTDRHWWFSDLAFNCFQEVSSRTKLLSHWLNCFGEIIPVPIKRLLFKPKPIMNDFTTLAAHSRSFVFGFSLFGSLGWDEGPALYKSVEFLECLHIPFRLTESTETFTIEDFLRKFQKTRNQCSCSLKFVLCFCDGQFQFYITNLTLFCNDHARLVFMETAAISVPTAATSLCSEWSCLKFLRSLEIRKCETVCDLLEQVPNPSKCSLKIGSFTLKTRSSDFESEVRWYGPAVSLTPPEAVRLASLLTRFDNVINLNLILKCSKEEEEALVTSITHKTLERLVLSGICLTPAAAAALGWSLPEMSSLRILVLEGCGNILLQTAEMEALFDGFSKTLPLYELTLSGFSVEGSVAPLTNSFRFFPNLTELHLGEFNMDGHNLCVLLKSLQFTLKLRSLSIQGNVPRQAHCHTAELDTVPSFTLKTLEELKLDGISLTPAAAAALGRLLPEMSSLLQLVLVGVDGSVLQAEEMEALFGKFHRALPLYKLSFSGFNARGCYAPLTKSFHFFPHLNELTLRNLNMDEHDQCGLLEGIRFIANVMKLIVRGKPLGDTPCCSVKFDSSVREITTQPLGISRPHNRLELNGIILTPAVAAALGCSLLQMPFLQELELTGAEGNILQSEEMEALFGVLNKPFPWYRLSFTGFNVKSCLAPLAKSFRLFPNLRELYLGEFNMDEHNLCGLLENLRFIPNLAQLRVTGKPLSYDHSCIAEASTVSGYPLEALTALELNGISLTPTAAVALGRLLPKMSSLLQLVLIGVDGSILQAEEMEAMFGGFKETLPLKRLVLEGFDVKGCLTPLVNSLRFFSNLTELWLEEFSVDEKNLFCLLDMLRFIPNLQKLVIHGKPLGHADCCLTEENTVGSYRFMLNNLKELFLVGICLTPTMASALGRSLPEMSSLQTLVLTAADGSIVPAEQMEGLFGEFSNKTLPMRNLAFSDFSVRGCLSPLTKSLQFFPNLTVLKLVKLNMGEHDLLGLLESFQFIPDLRELDLSGNPLGHAVRSIVPHINNLPTYCKLFLYQTGSEEDLNYVKKATVHRFCFSIFY